jgi:hypothetical protein
MQRRDVDHGIFCIDDLLSADDCETLIARAEAIGFEPALINTRSGEKRDERTRDNDRVIFDDTDCAAMLWKRVRQELSEFRAGRQARGLNERFRVYRYAPGQSFDWHSDGAFRRPNGEVSLLTFMIYLNAGYGGGTTAFTGHEIVGNRGMALIFEHSLWHSGSAVTEGVKYVLRSDVMYGPVGHQFGS